MIRRPPRSTLCPYTTLCRSLRSQSQHQERRTEAGTKETLVPQRAEMEDRLRSVRGGGRGYQNGGPPFANLSPRLSLFSDHLRTVLAVKGSLRRAQQRRALDG